MLTKHVTLSDQIIKWYRQHKRDLPWRNTRDPYKIWLSEIILQQTRVNQGLPYYEKFVMQFPEVTDLANASEQMVLQLWQGLGYYARGRNLHAAANYIVKECDGKFPATYRDIIQLKGVGEYTAAAIASFAFDEKVAVLDGNVIRVLTRYFGIGDDISNPTTIKELRLLANEQLPDKESADFNQGIMEFGALHCTPKSPDCHTCVLQDTCVAFADGKIEHLPYKSKKTKVRDRFFNYFVFTQGDFLWIKQRLQKDVWHKLYDFPLEETGALIAQDEFISLSASYLHRDAIQYVEVSKDYTHILSHQRLFTRFFRIELKQDFALAEKGLIKVNKAGLELYGKSILIENYLRDYIF